MDLRLHRDEDARALSLLGEEVWRPVAQAEGYWISNLGRFASQKKGATEPSILAGSVVNAGYVMYTVFRGSTKSTRVSETAQRLVLYSFDGEPPTQEHTDGRHLNGVKRDNRLCNLAWGTRSENMRDRWTYEPGPTAPEASLEPLPEGSRTTFDLDGRLVQVGLRFHADKKLGPRDLAMLWECSVEVATSVVNGTTWKHVPRPEPVAAKRKIPPAVRMQIRECILAGCSRDEINDALGISLSHQDIYYYKTTKNRAGDPK
jgi:hypothetical protein